MRYNTKGIPHLARLSSFVIGLPSFFAFMKYIRVIERLSTCPNFVLNDASVIIDFIFRTPMSARLKFKEDNKNYTPYFPYIFESSSVQLVSMESVFIDMRKYQILYVLNLM